MSGRQVMSPSAVSVEFSLPSSAQPKQILGGKVPFRKTSVDLKKSDNQSAGRKWTNPLGSGGKSSHKSSGEVATEPLTNGIELIGYRVTDRQSGNTTEQNAVSQQASDWTPLSTELPPCRVCGDKASGLHYGVYTCEACKAFFRRTLKKSSVNFKCTCTPEEKRFDLDVPRKTTCPKCRYERCIRTGMSKDAIKIGRYTISRKRQNDHEVKTLKQKETTSTDTAYDSVKSTKSSNSPNSASENISSPEELTSDITSLSLQEKNRQKARKRRRDDDEGLLYQSLTHSIFMSLLNNTQGETRQMSSDSSQENRLTPKKPNVTEISPVEQLLISYNQSHLEELSPDQGRDMSVENSTGIALEQDVDDFSPLMNIFNTYGEVLGIGQMGGTNQPVGSGKAVDSGEALISPMEDLFSAPFGAQSSVTNSMSPEVESNGHSQFSLSPYQNEEVMYSEPSNSNSSTEARLDSSTETRLDPFIEARLDPFTEAKLDPLLYGINDGSQINPESVVKVLQNGDVIIEESPIENLLTSPSLIEPYSTNVSDTLIYRETHSIGNTNMTDTSVRALQNGDVHNNFVSGFSNQLAEHESSMLFAQTNGQREATLGHDLVEQHGDVFIASKLNEDVNKKTDDCGFFNEEFEGVDFDENDFDEKPEDLEIQKQQLNRFENPSIQVGHGISIGEATNLIVTLVQAGAALIDNSKKMSCEEIKKRHADYLEQYQLKMKVFGNMSNISKEEYLDFFNQTGIEIDNRQQILIETLKYMEESIAKLVKFAKAIPGFSDLDIDDQVNLVKASRFEEGMIQFGKIGKCVKSSLKVATLPWNKEYHFDEISKIFPANFCVSKIKTLQNVMQLGLSFEETVVLKAVVLTFPDRCVLKEPQKVEYLHYRLIACFLFMLGSRPPEKLLSVQTVLKALFQVRRLAAWDKQILQEMFEVWPVTSNHQLVKEFVS